MQDRVLTGIKPTGYPHLGNYVGAIRPALDRAARSANSLFFIADYHALNQVQDRGEFNHLGYAVAATWLACGLDPSSSRLYRQSDIPEVFELATILAAFSPKGWMNKAHAYKAAVADNITAGRDRDTNVNMGLYTYPLLMAADILVFDATIVPVGRDQVQHVEIARDIALRVNSHYGEPVFVIPEYELRPDVAAIPGIDGRKMSKSYDNSIPLFAPSGDWRSLVYRIKTDSSAREARRQVAGIPVFDIFAALADAPRVFALRTQLESGAVGWGDAKASLLALIEELFGERAKTFNYLLAHPAELDDILSAGAREARPIAQSTMERVRSAIGRSGSVHPTRPGSPPA
jgi:tryptophanyl-tRNA synthetase